jgi:hypothetical protein
MDIIMLRCDDVFLFRFMHIPFFACIYTFLLEGILQSAVI